MRFPKPEKKPKKRTGEKHSAVCSRYKEQFYDRHGYLFCERCKRSDSPPYSTHHIYSAGKYPGHPELHNELNLILLCFRCHDMFDRFRAGWEQAFNELEAARGLKELFRRE